LRYQNFVKKALLVVDSQLHPRMPPLISSNMYNTLQPTPPLLSYDNTITNENNTREQPNINNLSDETAPMEEENLHSSSSSLNHKETESIHNHLTSSFSSPLNTIMQETINNITSDINNDGPSEITLTNNIIHEKSVVYSITPQQPVLAMNPMFEFNFSKQNEKENNNYLKKKWMIFHH